MGIGHGAARLDGAVVGARHDGRNDVALSQVEPPPAVPVVLQRVAVGDHVVGRCPVAMPFVEHAQLSFDCRVRGSL